MKWINLIPKPYQYIGLALLLAGLVYAFTQYQESLRQEGRDEERAKCNQEKLETINENIQIIENSKTIKRPNDDGYLRWLQSQSF